VIEVHGHPEQAIAEADARLTFLCGEKGLRCKAVCYDDPRQVSQPQVIHPVFDTPLFQYRIEPPAGYEVASFELLCEGCVRPIHFTVRDEGGLVIAEDREARCSDGTSQMCLLYVPLTNPPEEGFLPSPTSSKNSPPTSPNAEAVDEAAQGELDEELDEEPPAPVVKGTKTFFVEACVKAPVRHPEERKQLLREFAKQQAEEEQQEGEEEGEQNSAARPLNSNWTLAVQSVSAFDICFDSRRIEYEKALKTEWAKNDSKEAIRIDNARLARQRFLAAPPGTIHPPADGESVRPASQIRGSLPARKGQEIPPAEATLIASEQRLQRRQSVEAALKSFSELSATRAQHRQEVVRARSRQSESRNEYFRSLGPSKDAFWDTQDSRMDRIRGRLQSAKAARDGMDWNPKLLKIPSRPPKPVRLPLISPEKKKK